ncbi:MAG TPA: hypothetical protein VGA36_10890 [Nitriliruptorales bacterium]
MKRFLGAGMATLVLLSSCGGNGGEDATPTPTVSSGPTGTAAPGVTSSPAPFELPRVGVWGGVEIEVTEAHLANVVPTTFADPEPEVADVTTLFLTVAFGFEDGYPAPSTDFRITSFAVVSGAQAAPATSTDFSSSVLLRQGERPEVTLAFDPAGLDLSAATLVYDDQAHVPVTIALAGPASASELPVTVPLDAEATEVSWEGGCGDATGTVRPLEADFDLDDGIDHDGEPVLVTAPHRAENGRIFVRITVQVVATAGTCGGSLPGDDQFRLVADGLPLGPINQDTELLENGEGFEFVWGFDVPSDAGELILEVGTTEGTTASFPVPIPAELAAALA